MNIGDKVLYMNSQKTETKDLQKISEGFPANIELTIKEIKKETAICEYTLNGQSKEIELPLNKLQKK